MNAVLYGRMLAALKEFKPYGLHEPDNMGDGPIACRCSQCCFYNEANDILAEAAKPQPPDPLKVIRELAGYVEDGSSQAVVIGQDDATKDWLIHAGKQWWTFGQSLVEVFQKAATKLEEERGKE